MVYKPVCMFSATLSDLQNCYEKMNFNLESVCSDAGLEYEHLRRAQLIQLCVKIAAEYGREVEDMRPLG